VSTHRPQTIAQTLARGIVSLAKTSESPRTDALLLLARVVGRRREWIVAHGEAFLTKSQADAFVGLCETRAEGRPLAYVLGFAGFYGREFAVDGTVMVPRPETEHLVDEALAHIKERVDPNLPKRFVTALDVGIGSGAIACTIAAENANVFVEGTDTSQSAVEVAEHNARRLNVIGRCRFHYGSLASPVGERTFDVVIANLPYVLSADIPKAPDPLAFEPREALDGGADGLEAYRQFLPSAPGLLKPAGLLLLEAAPPVIDGLVGLVAAAFPQTELKVCEDFAGLARYVKLKTAPR
jgi:release factor glutamine methyltransferase